MKHRKIIAFMNICLMLIFINKAGTIDDNLNTVQSSRETSKHSNVINGDMKNDIYVVYGMSVPTKEEMDAQAKMFLRRSEACEYLKSIHYESITDASINAVMCLKEFRQTNAPTREDIICCLTSMGTR